jgi:hypothetical protein
VARGICQDCGREAWLHKHHLKLQAQGGTDADGVVFICGACHDDRHGGPKGGKSGHTPEAHAKMSAAMSARNRRRFENPSERARQSATLQRIWSDPGRRARLSAAVRASMRDPEVRAKISRAQVARWRYRIKPRMNDVDN